MPACEDDENAKVLSLQQKALRPTRSDRAVWWYDQKRKRCGERRYSGHVHHVHGVEAERVRGELAAVVLDLLSWAGQQQFDDQSVEDGEAA